MITEDAPDFPAFRDALCATTADLAKRLVRDGEGATKFVTVRVQVGVQNHRPQPVHPAVPWPLPAHASYALAQAANIVPRRTHAAVLEPHAAVLQPHAPDLGFPRPSRFFFCVFRGRARSPRPSRWRRRCAGPTWSRRPSLARTPTGAGSSAPSATAACRSSRPSQWAFALGCPRAKRHSLTHVCWAGACGQGEHVVRDGGGRHQ